MNRLQSIIARAKREASEPAAPIGHVETAPAPADVPAMSEQEAREIGESFFRGDSQWR